MAFKVTVLDNEGNVVDWKRFDAEVCELWGVEQVDDHWCRHPGEYGDGYCEDWDELMGHSIFLLRRIDGSADTVYSASDLFKGLVLGGRWYPTLDKIEEYRYEIQLLFFWISKEYTFKVENTSKFY